MSSDTSASPVARRARMARLVGSASAAKAALRESREVSIAIWIYYRMAIYCQERCGSTVSTVIEEGPACAQTMGTLGPLQARPSGQATVLCRGYGNHAEGTAAAIDDLERRRNYDRACRRQLIEIAQAREPELAGAVHRRMVGKRRSERARLTRVGSDRLHADTEHVAVLREQLRRARIEPRAVRPILASVDERRGVGPPAPPGPQQHPRPARNASVSRFPLFEPLGRQQEIGIARHVAGDVDHTCRPDEPRHRNRVARVVREI